MGPFERVSLQMPERLDDLQRSGTSQPQPSQNGTESALIPTAAQHTQTHQSRCLSTSRQRLS